MAPNNEEFKHHSPPATPTPKVNNAPTRAPRYDIGLDVLERICEIEQIRGSGPGGQHRNKAHTGVRLTHPPSGMVVTATERRSYPQNRAAAFLRLVEKLKDLMKVQRKRKATRVPRGVKRKRLEKKRRRADVKKTRGKVKW